MIGSLLQLTRQAIARFKEDPEYRELIKTSISSLVIRLIGVGTGFLVTLVTSRYFGAEALGIVSICIAILSLSTVFGKAGLDVALMKFVAEEGARQNYAAIKGLYLLSLKIILPVSLILSLILFFGSDWMSDTVFHKPYLSGIFRLNALMVLPLVFLLFHSECVRGLKQVNAYTFFQTAAVSTFAIILLLTAVFTNHVPKQIPVYIQFTSICLAGLLCTLSWIRQSKFVKHAAGNSHTIKELSKTASPMFMTTLMQLLMSWAGTLILASYVSGSEVGVYNALIRISAFTNITILAINSIAMPRFAEAFTTGGKRLLKRHAHEASRLIFLSSLPIFILLGFFPKFILSVFGKEFPGNEPSLYILLAMQLVVVISGLPAQILNMTGRQHNLRNIAIVAAIVNISACFILIPPYGILGACLAQFAGTFCWNALTIWSVYRHFGFFAFFYPYRINR